MKNNLRSLSRIVAVSIALAASHIAMAGTDIWTGGGEYRLAFSSQLVGW